MSLMTPSINKRPAETQEPEEDASPAKRRAIEEDPGDKENDRRLNSESIASPRRQINPPGKPPEAGIIKQIYVENFMCHRKLRVDLCRNVNFVHGQNGSGKSAILAAIQICLGAGARRTHRARNLKELVRKDSTSNAPTGAKIRVTLLNQGEDGYMHDVYGDTITVERSISLKGGYNGYKLLDHKGVERSRNKKDLDEMLDVLNIQVENPVAVLDQEEAKKFLMGKGEEKYQFFMKATELERVDRTYAATVDKVQELTDAQEKIKDNLQADEKHKDAQKKKWEEHQALEKTEAKIQQLNVKYAWAYYNAVDEEYQEAVKGMETFQQKAAKKQEELSQAEAAASSGDNEGDRRKQRIIDLNEEAQEHAERKRELEAELKRVLVPHKTTERQLAHLQKQQREAERQLAVARQRLQEARDQIVAQAGSAQSEEARRTALLKTTEEELAEARGKVNDLRQAVGVALRSYEDLEPHVQDARANTERLSRQHDSVRNRISELNASGGDSLAIFGQRVTKVCRLIEQAKKQRKFKGPVVGPIGAHIKVAVGKEEFAALAELAIGGGTLDRFIVTNDNDRRVLQEIRKKCGCVQDCGVFQVHESPRFQIPDPPVKDVETVASVLNITNDLVFNCLVDNARIDQRALTKDKASSERSLLVKNGNGKYSIRGIIKEVFFLPKGDNWSVRGGTISIMSNEKNFRNTIGVDKSAAIEQASQEAAQLKNELKEVRSTEARLEQEHTKYQREWNQAKKAMQKNDSLINKLEDKINQIKTEIDTTANVTIDTTEYEEDVSQAEQALESLRDSESQIKGQLEKSAPEVNQVRARLDETAMRNEKILQDLQAANEEMTQYLDTQSQRQDIIEKKRKKVDQYKEIISKHQEKVDKLAADNESALLMARKLHYRFLKRQELSQASEASESPQDQSQLEPTPEELDAIEPQQMKREPKFYETRIRREKENLEKERQRRKVSNEDPTVAYERYMRAKNDFDAKLKQVRELDDKIAEVNTDICARRKKWRAFQKALTRKTNLKFSEMLTLNNYAGELDFDHKSNTLDLAVQKDNNNAASQTKDVKGLSGGERSYTTMCLLLALGETLETPFRILDEFDVFLDAQVRKLTIKSLIHVAKQMEHRQFIFITPQDLSSLTPDPQLKILKLTPPARYHTAGGPSQQTLEFSQASS